MGNLDNGRVEQIDDDLKFIDIAADDLKVVKEIYDYYILTTTATFHTDLIALSELQEIIPIGHPKYRSFLIDYKGNVCGYCYLSPYKKRPAYNRTAEVTIYLKPDFSEKGIGKVVLGALGSIAKDHDMSVLIGFITGGNYSSVRLFEKCGYEKCAHFKQVGEKFNKLLDVVAYQKILN